MERFTNGLGLDDARYTQPTIITVDGGRQGHSHTVVIASTARDGGSTPSTTLRAGLVLGSITTSDKYMEYDDSGTVGNAVARAILMKDVNLLNTAGTAADAQADVHTGGYYVAGNLIGLDANGRVDLQKAGQGAKFDDEVRPT